MRQIRLWNASGVLVIICCPSGVKYTNQTCGHACRHPSEEGVLAPFNFDALPEDYESTLEGRLSTLLADVQYLNANLADEIDAILATSQETRGARVDRSRLNESHESWLYVDLVELPEGLLTGFGVCKAVLTWPNSD